MEDAIGGLVGLAIVALMIASMWVVMTKANEPGWAAIIPIYNIIVMLKIAGKPIWWILLFLIPVVNFVIYVLLYVSLAKSFGKSALFGIGMLVLAPIFWPMLAFGDARYQGPAG